MAFTKETPIVPSGIGEMTVILYTHDEVSPLVVTGQVSILGTTGNVIRTLYIDLLPHLTAGQISTMETFMANLRGKAETEIL